MSIIKPLAIIAGIFLLGNIGKQVVTDVVNNIEFTFKKVKFRLQGWKIFVDVTATITNRNDFNIDITHLKGDVEYAGTSIGTVENSNPVTLIPNQITDYIATLETGWIGVANNIVTMIATGQVLSPIRFIGEIGTAPLGNIAIDANIPIATGSSLAFQNQVDGNLTMLSLGMQPATEQQTQDFLNNSERFIQYNSTRR